MKQEPHHHDRHRPAHRADSYAAGKPAKSGPPLPLIGLIAVLVLGAGALAFHFGSGPDEGEPAVAEPTDPATQEATDDENWRAELDRLVGELEKRREQLTAEIWQLEQEVRDLGIEPPEPQYATPTRLSGKPSQWPAWARELLSTTEGEIDALERTLEKLRRFLEEAKARKREEEIDATLKASEPPPPPPSYTPPSPPPPRPAPPPPPDERPPTASGCSWWETYNGKTSFRFQVSNPGSSTVSIQAEIYFLEHDLLTGSDESLVTSVPLTLEPGESLDVERSWVIIAPEDGLTACTVRLK